MPGDAAITSPVAPAGLDWQRRQLTLRHALGWIALYVAVAMLTVQLAGGSEVVLPWFPPVGVSLAVALVYGWRAAPVIFIADASVIMLREIDTGPAEVVIPALVQAAVWTGVGTLMRPRLPRGEPLARVDAMACLVLGGALAGSAISAAVALFTLDQLAMAQWSTALALTFFVGDVVGVAATTPTILILVAWYSHPRALVRTLTHRISATEASLMITSLIVVPASLVLLDMNELIVLAPLPVAWAALRRGMPIAALAASLWTLSGVVAFRFASGQVSLQQISAAMAAGAMFALLVGAVVSERERARVRLAYLALWDEQTGVQNRLGLVAALKRMLSARPRGRGDVALMVVRVAVPGPRRIGVVGDIAPLLSHTVGELLRLTTPDATIARIGADEFAVVVEGPDVDRIDALADDVVEALSRPVSVGAREYVLDPAVGIVRAGAATPDAADIEQLLQSAERAVGAAQGPRRAVNFDEQLRGDLQQDEALADALGYALHRGELHLAYQPIVSITDGRPLAAEALLRWTHPELGPVGPDRFIPVAERCGLILPIGRWVLREACARAADWPSDGVQPPMVHVNVSPVQLHDQSLPRYVGGLLKEYGLEPARLCLELTESALFDDFDVATARIGELAELGVHLSLDDFGTGASSLSWLQRLPVTSLKVDRSFVDGIEQRDVDWAIVSATLGLAQSLKVVTVAEGVERPEQLTMLAGSGCVAAQGYLISRPLPGEEIDRWLNERISPGGVHDRRLRRA